MKPTNVLKTASANASSSESVMLGDADGNGVVNIDDVTLVQKVLAELKSDPDGMITLRGDIDGGGLSITDATLIQRFIAGYDDKNGISEAIQSSTNTPEKSEPETESKTEATKTEVYDTTGAPTEEATAKVTEKPPTQETTSAQSATQATDYFADNEIPFYID